MAVTLYGSKQNIIQVVQTTKSDRLFPPMGCVEKLSPLQISTTLPLQAKTISRVLGVFFIQNLLKIILISKNAIPL